MGVECAERGALVGHDNVLPSTLAKTSQARPSTSSRSYCCLPSSTLLVTNAGTPLGLPTLSFMTVHFLPMNSVLFVSGDDLLYGLSSCNRVCQGVLSGG